MEIDEKTLRCDGCGIEIRWHPLLTGKLAFCCNDCLHGRTCECQDRLEIEEDHREGQSSSSIGISLSEYSS
jgi:hypothetical protein